MIRHQIRLAAAAAACFVLAACSGPANMEPPNIDVPTPLPSGIDFEPDIETAPVDESCDPLASYSPGAVTAEQARAQLDDGEQISIGISQSTNLMGYRDPETNALAGFDIDIATAVAEAVLGADANIRWVPMTSNERVPSLDEDRVDLIVRTMTMNCDRWNEVEFSAEYYHAGQRLLVPTASGITGLADLTADHLVCTGNGSTSVRTIAEQSEAQAVTVPDFNDCLVLLQQGTVDAITTDDTILAGMAVQDPTLQVVGDAFSVEPYGIAFQKGNTDLARFVNGALETIIADGTWQAAYDKWLKGPLAVEGAPPGPKYRD
ncbi:glutamate ABC transporter substrate-binding protein [Glycomyces harbinensis]|uniref:Polar amino acid transport system substrate-binding protein n=1 Tax=Glycomyces harbinensis TaxID=58114 RepID=A0A1G6U0J9_9ACTN|nr:glutamate ABC transporter substrate-binding protein [Glycomyces harbinensis]SDD34848.1 polar amino acid transport system substrate-binding protein [Glycomyces harbinensis]